MGAEVSERLEQLSRMSESPTQITRTFLSAAHGHAREQIRLWMARARLSRAVKRKACSPHHQLSPAATPSTPRRRMRCACCACCTASRPRICCRRPGLPPCAKPCADAAPTCLRGPPLQGLEVTVDALGNVRGRAPQSAQSASPSASPPPPPLVLGSHYDSVPDGGAFDGALGVVAAISAAKALLSAQSALPSPLEVVAFSDEEGARFQTTFLGSRALAGTFDHTLLETAVDCRGVGLGAALAAGGFDPSPQALAAAALPEGWAGAYVEVHIEQAPSPGRSSRRTAREEPFSLVMSLFYLNKII